MLLMTSATPHPTPPPTVLPYAGFSIAGGALWASLIFCLAFAFYIATGAAQRGAVDHLLCPLKMLHALCAWRTALSSLLSLPTTAVVPAEERMLKDAFGDQYTRYA